MFCCILEYPVDLALFIDRGIISHCKVRPTWHKSSLGVSVRSIPFRSVFALSQYHLNGCSFMITFKLTVPSLWALFFICKIVFGVSWFFSSPCTFWICLIRFQENSFWAVEWDSIEFTHQFKDHLNILLTISNLPTYECSFTSVSSYSLISLIIIM